MREKRCYTNKLWKVNSTTLMDHIDIEYPLGGEKKKKKTRLEMVGLRRHGNTEKSSPTHHRTQRLSEETI